MNEHDLYMNDFMRVYETLDYWGPGSEADTLKALKMVSLPPKTILDIGCGKGLATKVLAENSDAVVTALDNEQSALDRLEGRFNKLGMSDRLKTVNASMAELPFSHNSFDLIWAEGSAYIIGVEKALEKWKPYLTEQGHLVFSDLVWHTDTPSDEAVQKWREEYPDMQDVDTRLDQMKKAGYQICDHFRVSNEAWMNYYGPLDIRLKELESEMANSAAYKDIKHEVEIAMRYAEEFGYHMFILKV